MLFSSITFLFFFLPAVVVLHAVLPARWRNAFLLAASVAFYCFGDAKYLPLLLLITVLDWLFGLGLSAWTGWKRRMVLILAVGVNVLALGYYKYVGMLPFVTTPPALPLGISFFIFQSLSYILDVQAGRVQAERSLPDYAAYILLFPQLIAGPIVRYDDVARELHERELLPNRLEKGMTDFIIGLSSKVLLANQLGAAYEALLAIPQRGMLATAAMLLCYGFQLYYDFHGYSLMAIGIGRMLGFEFPQNFNHPFVSRSIGEFWRRWHMTLGSWLRTYIYIPLGGSRRGTARRVVNLLITWGLSGLWHGAGLNFLAWGLYFGALIALEAVLIGPWLQKHPRLGRVYAFTAVLLSWVLFTGDSAAVMAGTLGQLFNPALGTNVLFTLGCFLPVILAGCLLAGEQLCRRLSRLMEKPPLRIALCLALLALCVASLLRSSYNPFLYFRF